MTLDGASRDAQGQPSPVHARADGPAARRHSPMPMFREWRLTWSRPPAWRRDVYYPNARYEGRGRCPAGRNLGPAAIGSEAHSTAGTILASITARLAPVKSGLARIRTGLSGTRGGLGPGRFGLAPIRNRLTSVHARPGPRLAVIGLAAVVLVAFAGTSVMLGLSAAPSPTPVPSVVAAV